MKKKLPQRMMKTLLQTVYDENISQVKYDEDTAADSL